MSLRGKRKRRRADAAAELEAECDSAAESADCEHEFGPSCGGADAPPAYAPAYHLSGRGSRKRQCRGTGGSAAGGGGGPQCSEHPDVFCFFCSYEKDPNAEAGSAADLYGSLVDLVNSMTRQNKEFPAIVDAVSVAYETQIRPHVHDPDFGASPEWTAEAIERHLTFSNQFGGVFDSAVTQVFHALISSQNDTVMDATTGHVIEENRSALMNTLDHYMKWQRFQKSSAGRGGGSAAAAGGGGKR